MGFIPNEVARSLFRKSALSMLASMNVTLITIDNAE